MEDFYVSRGPVSSMPGSAHSVPEGTMCDTHADRPAVARIQGETDSFGCEYVMMCQECRDEHRNYKNMGFCGTCQPFRERRPTDQPQQLFAYRDYDEGMAGPIYYQCGPCRTARLKSEAEEAERYYNDNGAFDPFFDDDFGD